MSGMAIFWTSLVFSIHIPDISVHIPDIIFFLLSMFWTSTWYPEYGQFSLAIFQTSMIDEIWPVKTGYTPNINIWCPEYGQVSLAIFMLLVRVQVFTRHVPDINLWCREYGQFLLVIFQTSTSDVQNMASFHWPYSGHQLLMSGIRTTILSLFRTSLFIFQTSLSMFRTSLSIGHQLSISKIWPVFQTWPYSAHRT